MAAAAATASAAAALVSVPSLSDQRPCTVDTPTASSTSSSPSPHSSSCRLVFSRNSNRKSSGTSSPMISCCSRVHRTATSNSKDTPANSLSPSPLRTAEDLTPRLGLHVLAVVAGLERLFSSPTYSPLAPVLPSPGSGDNAHPPDVPDPSHGRRPLRVAYQGSLGSYCQEAAAVAFSAFPASRLAAFPCSHMEDAFAALEDGTADRAVVPAENSLDGTIHRNLDLLLRHPGVELAGEIVLPVNHCLLVLPCADRATLGRVASHPQALAHCRARLAALGLEAHEVPNAADAARALADGRLDAGTAVVGSRIAAREFGLVVLQENLQDPPGGGNYTRFLQLALRSPEDSACSRHRPATVGRSKATVAFSLEKGPSELFRALWAFESRGIAVTRVDHRPNRSSPFRVGCRAGSAEAYFDYVFIVDVEETDPTATAGCYSAFDSAVDWLREICGFVRVLGRYELPLTRGSHRAWRRQMTCRADERTNED